MNASLDFKPANGLDAKSLSGLILDTLKSYGLDIALCLVGQGYDGASIMRGVNKGVQQLVRQSAPLAIHVHCYAHKLNLIDACKSVPEARDFFALLERLYVFTSGSPMHKKWVEAQNELYLGEPARQLQRLSDTRWASRVVSCRNIRDRLDALVYMLQDVAGGTNADRAVHSFIPAISIPPLQVLYYSEALPTTTRILYRSFTPKRTGYCR